MPASFNFLVSGALPNKFKAPITLSVSRLESSIIPRIEILQVDLTGIEPKPFRPKKLIFSHPQEPQDFEFETGSLIPQINQFFGQTVQDLTVTLVFEYFRKEYSLPLPYSRIFI